MRAVGKRKGHAGSEEHRAHEILAGAGPDAAVVLVRCKDQQARQMVAAAAAGNAEASWAGSLTEFLAGLDPGPADDSVRAAAAEPPPAPGARRAAASRSGPVTEGKGPGSGARREARLPSRMIVRGVLPIAGSAAVLVARYYLLPLSRSPVASAVTIPGTGRAVFIGLAAVQVRAIIRSRFPCGASKPWLPASRCSCPCSPAATSPWPGCRPAALAAVLATVKATS